MSPRFHKLLKALLTIPMVMFSLADLPVAYANDCTDKIVNQCKGQATSALGGITSGTTGAGTGLQNQLASNAAATQQTAANLGVAAGNCNQAVDQCKQCKGASASDVKDCQKQVQAQAQTMQTQSQQLQSSGSNTGAIAGMMAGLAGAALGYMLAKQQQQQQPTPTPAPVAAGALQLNGTLNCQMGDSYQYADCAPYLEQVCAPAVQAAQAAATATPGLVATGTVISSASGVAATPNCAAFNGSFCSSTVTPVQPDGYTRSDGSVTEVNLAGTGQGLGTAYCSSTVAYSWCTDPELGPSRASCPSCLQVSTTQSAACAANPSLCLVQNTASQTTGLPAACAGDPLYTAGSPYAAGAGVIASTGTTAVPTVSLTASTNNLGNSGVKAGASSAVAAMASGTSSTGLNNTINGTAREGAAVARGVQAGASLSAAATAQAMKVAASKGPNELFAAGGVIVARGTASTVSSGPTSDIQSQYGPSLFTTSTAVIQSYCQAGKLYNCK